MSNGTNGETLTAVYERPLYQNDVCLTDLCVPVHSICCIWYTLAWSGSWCKSQLYSLSLLFYIHFYITCLASLIVLSLGFREHRREIRFTSPPPLEVEPRAKLAHSPCLRHRWHVNPSQSTIHRSIATSSNTSLTRFMTHVSDTFALHVFACTDYLRLPPAITRASTREKCPYIASQCLSRVRRCSSKDLDISFFSLSVYCIYARCRYVAEARYTISRNI